MNVEEVFSIVLDCSFKVHSALGPGLLESAYEECLYYELQKAGLKVEKQKAIPVIYKEIKLDCGYRADLIIEDKIVIELKTVDEFNPVHEAQILTYLKFAEKKLGLLINFNVLRLKDGIKRYIL